MVAESLQRLDPDICRAGGQAVRGTNKLDVVSRIIKLVLAMLIAPHLLLACGPDTDEIRKIVKAEIAKIEVPPGEQGPQGVAGPPGPAPTILSIPSQVIERYGAAVVQVQTPGILASGFIYETRGTTSIVITTDLVGQEGRYIDVYVEGSGTYRASLLGFDETLNVAVLSICCGEFTSFDRISESVGRWEWVTALCRPFESSPELTTHYGKVLRFEEFSDVPRVIWFDAPIVSGCLGSPVVDIQGSVIGYAFGESTKTEGTFAAVPVDEDIINKWTAAVLVTD